MVALPEHYAAVDQILSDHPDAKVFRIHEKGNNNATADNALEEASLWLVMSGVVHRWVLSTLLVHAALVYMHRAATGPQVISIRCLGEHGHRHAEVSV